MDAYAHGRRVHGKLRRMVGRWRHQFRAAAGYRSPGRAASRTRRRPPARSGPSVPISMIPSRRAKASIWRAPLGRVAEERHQRGGELLGGAVPLQELRHDVLAQHQIGQDDALDLDQQRGRSVPRSAAPCRRRPSARRRPRVRASRCRIWRAPPARCGTPRPCPAGSVTIARRHRPGRHRRPHRSASRGTAGTTTSSGPGPRPRRADRLAEHGRHAADLARAAAGQHQDAAADRRARRCASSAFGRSRATCSPSGWPTKVQGGPPSRRMRRRLERQQRQHVIDIGAHGARAARPPRPDRRATRSRRSGWPARARARGARPGG